MVEGTGSPLLGGVAGAGAGFGRFGTAARQLSQVVAGTHKQLPQSI